MQNILLQGINLNQLLEKIGELIENKVSDLVPAKPNKIQSGYITRKEVSKLLKISLPTLHEWTKFGMLQSYKIGNRVLYKQQEVEESLHKVTSLKYRKGGINHA